MSAGPTLRVRAASRIALVVALFFACSAEGKPTPAPAVAEPAKAAANSTNPWARTAQALLAFADGAKDADSRAFAVREIGAFADRAPPAGQSAADVAETRQRLYARAAQLAFDVEAPERALRLATRGLRARADGAARAQLLTLVVRAKRRLGDEAGALEAERELQASSQ